MQYCVFYTSKWDWQPGGRELTLLVPGNCQLTVEGSPSYFEAGAARMNVTKAGPATWEACVFEGPWGLLFSSPATQLSCITLGFGLKNKQCEPNCLMIRSQPSEG